MAGCRFHFRGTQALNVSLKQPLQAESRADVQMRDARLAQSAPVMPETQKQRVRRLAAHCQKYRGPVPKLAVQQLLTTLVPLVLIVGVMFATVEHAYWATLLLALPAAGLLVRAFIIQHDCGHGSFFASRPLNDLVGRSMSLLTARDASNAATNMISPCTKLVTETWVSPLPILSGVSR